jgi:hypothetical protein
MILSRVTGFQFNWRVATRTIGWIYLFPAHKNFNCRFIFFITPLLLRRYFPPLFSAVIITPLFSAVIFFRRIFCAKKSKILYVHFK